MHLWKLDGEKSCQIRKWFCFVLAVHGEKWWPSVQGKGKSPMRSSALPGPLCSWLWQAFLHCSWLRQLLSLTLIRKSHKVGVSGNDTRENSSWFLFGSRVKSEEHLSAYSGELQDLLNGLLGPAKLSSHGTKRQDPKGRIPGASAASLDAFRECRMFYGLLCPISSLSSYLFIIIPYFYSFALPCKCFSCFLFP